MNIFSNSSILLNFLYLMLMIGTVIGGIIAFRVGISRTASEIQERVINALKDEIDTLKDKVSDLEKENTRLNQTMSLIRKALHKRGLTITIDGDLVSISDAQGNTHQAGRIQENQ